jgi:NADH-ubiquinone oxidoreductase chain 4
MLLAVITIQSNVGSTDFQIISFSEISLESQKWLWLAFFLAFAIKTPIWPLNTWLIKAHVEAPLAGSIILAGTILKLSTYGILRVLLPFFPDASNFFSPLVQTLAIISLVYASLATIRQNDTKAVIAYSSVAHMAVITLGLFSNNILGLEGAVLLALGHGFVSPALFIICGGIIYSRTHSRVIAYHRGLSFYMPVLSILFLFFSLANAGIPLSLNFLGEQLALIGTWEQSPIVAALGATGIVLSACYSLFLYNRISYGSYSPYLLPLKDVDRREFTLLTTLLIPTLLLGIFPNTVLDSLHLSLSTLLYTVAA